jgi:hypothetical protein
MQNFVSLGVEHALQWMMYVQGDAQIRAVCQERLMANVRQTCALIDERYLCMGALLRGRFEHSARTEVQLVHDFANAKVELEDCHQSVAKALGSLFDGPWQTLWLNQRNAMFAYLRSPTIKNELECTACAIAVGKSLNTAFKIPN